MSNSQIHICATILLHRPPLDGTGAAEELEYEEERNFLWGCLQFLHRCAGGHLALYTFLHAGHASKRWVPKHTARNSYIRSYLAKLAEKTPPFVFLISVFPIFFLHMLTEIVNKVRTPPPLCRPIMSVEEAPVDVIQLMKQAWSEEPDKRPTFEDIFKQVGHVFLCNLTVKLPLLIALFHITVQVHHKGKEDQPH